MWTENKIFFNASQKLLIKNYFIYFKKRLHNKETAITVPVRHKSRINNLKNNFLHQEYNEIVSPIVNEAAWHDKHDKHIILLWDL